MVTAASNISPLNCKSISILSINLTADQQTAPDDHPRITVLSPSAVNFSSSSPQPEVESLDSRIENLLINSQSADPSYLRRQTLEADVRSEDSPTSPCSANNSPFSDGSLVCTLMSSGPLAGNNQRSNIEPVHHQDAAVCLSEDDETSQAVLFLKRNFQSPSPYDGACFDRRDLTNNKKDGEGFQSLSCPKVSPVDI